MDLEETKISSSKYYKLLSGLGPETSFGRTIAIRSETNKDIIKNFNSSQKAIYYGWQDRQKEKIIERDNIISLEITKALDSFFGRNKR